ncbi:uncharacterized protein BKCO1_2200068 [Diplodia corticola]|uniref:Uncharacterized protein n=1 Tax=Diplodia corticola TaxID=236234 RepID=A0A1J9R1Y5_9PEZI|nr:uncharacterized protein BKCO1_2200068 [Diplodia corticola]OJD34601.1 hypothetical protein BKCO1_2200068 [Diplodia corticola]
MADGLNDARAIRIAEIMTDFRNLQHYIAQIRVSPAPDEFYLQGYTLVRQCHAEAQAILNAPFDANTSPGESVEQQKTLLKAVLLDSSIRRFRCQRVYLRATAAMRWINSRGALLREEGASAEALQKVDESLQSELANITDEYVEYSLRSEDAQQGKWLHEDPGLAVIQQCLFE